jgi:TolB-like protein
MTSIQNFFAELKRRNVVRAGAAYVVLAWLVIQVADILFETFAVPNWVMQALVIALAIGLPIVLVGAWVYELTREGLKRTKEVELAESITFQTRRKLDFVIAGVLITAVAIFAVDKFVLQPGNAERNYTLAVMPFEIVSSDVAPFFAQLSGDLVRILKRSSQMRLASTDAVDALPDIRDAVASSARLGVRYLISGSISSSAGSVGLKVSIFDSDSGKQVWQRDFENAHSQATLKRPMSCTCRPGGSPHQRMQAPRRRSCSGMRSRWTRGLRRHWRDCAIYWYRATAGRAHRRISRRPRNTAIGRGRSTLTQRKYSERSATCISRAGRSGRSSSCCTSLISTRAVRLPTGVCNTSTSGRAAIPRPLLTRRGRLISYLATGERCQTSQATW